MINYLKNLIDRKITCYLLLHFLIGFSQLSPDVSAQNDTLSINEQNKSIRSNDISLFSRDDILQVSIYLDLARFSKKPSRTDAFDGEMTIYLNSTDSVNSQVTIKYRGISRYELCTFPPMQINLKKTLTCDSTKIKKLKLVTHCHANIINDEYVLREYLVYKLFNALTDTSFRARLLRVSYIDAEKKKKTIVKYGIFLEPDEMIAKRINSSIVRTGSLNQSHINPRVMDRLAIFNYMVTNWDWSIPGKHNVQVFKPMSFNQEATGIAVPYDFDLTGVVNADYAIPPPYLGIENVREPIFAGICRTRDVYREDLKRFLESKEELYSVVNEFQHLNQRSKKDITSFLDQFYKNLEKPKSLESLIDIFMSTCRK